MGKIIRYEYVGTVFNSLFILIATCTVVGIPFAIIHILENMIRIDDEIDNPNEFIDKFRKGEIRRK